MDKLEANLTIQDILSSRPLPCSGTLEDLKNTITNYTLCVKNSKGLTSRAYTIEIDDVTRKIFIGERQN